MNLFNKLKEYYKKYKQSMLTVNNNKLTTGSKVTLLVFVITLFSVIGYGVSLQKNNVTSPNVEYGYKCMSTISNYSDIYKFQNRNVTEDIYGNFYGKKYWKLEDFKYNHHRNSERQILTRFGKNKLCNKMGILYLNVANSENYKDKLIIQNGLKNKINIEENIILKKESEYSDSLLEKIAKQDSDLSILSITSKNIKQQLKELRDKIQIRKSELEKIENMKTLKDFNLFVKYINENKEEIKKDYKSEVREYQIKKTISVFIFLFPLWLFFYLSHRFLFKRSWFILSHLTVNVANISALYILIYFISLIYDIMPKIFLNKLILILSRYDLEVLVNVLIIFILIIFFGFFIKKIQSNKKEEIKNKDIKNKIIEIRKKEKQSCLYCGNKTKEKDIFCGLCGGELLKKCKKCESDNNIYNTYCTYCKYLF